MPMNPTRLDWLSEYSYESLTFEGNMTGSR
jgi:hypothetical protein